jgi:ferredoxin-NADP reductase
MQLDTLVLACRTAAGLLLHCVVVSLALSMPAYGQGADEHASHHRAEGADPTPPMSSDMPNTTPGNTRGSPSSGMGMGGMGEMMGGTSTKELYPSLMEMTELSAEKREELKRLARERMAAGTALMSTALEKLNATPTDPDLPTMRDAAAQMREGALQFESGVATLQASAEGRAPPTIALDWFKRSMDLLPAADMETPHGIFALSAFHYITMFVLIAFATTMIVLNLRKVRRTEVLAAKLTGGGRANNAARADSVALAAESPPGQAAAPIQAPLASSTMLNAPSKPNSWTGLLRVVRLFDETPNVRTLRLAEPSGGEIPFRHLPGQFVTFTVRPIDQQVKRSYTIASSPTRRDFIDVTVKREAQGTVSNFLHHMHEGDTVQVTGPSGNFTFIGEEANSIVLVSGGVGITPMMSVVRYLTDRSWRGDIFFLFGSRTEQDIIYREELEYLRRRHPNLHLTIAISNPETVDSPYAKGNITKELLTQSVPHIATRRVHICGPKGMMDAVKAMLIDSGLGLEQIKTEVFIGKERPVTPAKTATGVASVEAIPEALPEAKTESETQAAVLTFARSNQTALLPPTKSVLEASEEVGVNIDYSCRVGVCGICKVKLLKGSVTMEVQESLDADDKKNNIILACQAKSTADLSVDA